MTIRNSVIERTSLALYATHLKVLAAYQSNGNRGDLKEFAGRNKPPLSLVFFL